MFALEAGERFLDHAADRNLQGLFPLSALVGGIDVEAAEFTDGGRLAGAELDPPVGEQVQRGDAFGHPGGMIDRGRQVHDAEPQPDVVGALAGGGQEDLGRRGMAVLLEEMVLSEPHRRESRLVGGLDLIEAVLQHDPFVVGRPGPG